MQPTPADLKALQTLSDSGQRGDRFPQLAALGLAFCAFGTGLYFPTSEGKRALGTPLALDTTMPKTKKAAPRYTDAQLLHWGACHADYRSGSIAAGDAACLVLNTETGGTELRPLSQC